jgi:hypothetical protein
MPLDSSGRVLRSLVLVRCMRDDFAETTKQALARRVAYVCSNPDCGALTSGPNSDPSKAVMVGVAAHITAAAPGGARYNALLTAHQRRQADNGIWLCQICGKRVDDDELTYPEELLLAWKRNAEAGAWARLGKTAPYGLIASRDVIDALSSHIADEDVQVVVNEGMRRLSSLYPGQTLNLHAEGDQLILELTPSDPTLSPRTVSFTPTFPDTPEGRERAAAFDAFVRIGEPVELHGGDIPLEQLPVEIRVLAEKQGEFRLRLGAARSSHPMIVSIAFEGENGHSYLFPYVDLRVVSSGSERTVVTNDEQPIPFKFSITLTPDGGAGIEWSFDLVDVPMFWYREFLGFKQAIQTPARATMTSLDDGLRSISKLPTKASDEVIDERIIRLADRVLAIQNRTGTAIRLPPRGFFDEADEASILWFEHVLANGTQPSPPVDFRLTAFDESGRIVVERYPGGPFKAYLPSQVERLLDNDVDLGPAWVACPQVTIVPLGTRDVDGRRGFEFRIAPGDGLKLEVTYDRFSATPPASTAVSRETVGRL